METKIKKAIDECSSCEDELSNVTSKWMKTWQDQGLTASEAITRLLTAITTFNGTMTAISVCVLKDDKEGRAQLLRKVLEKMLPKSIEFGLIRLQHLNSVPDETLEKIAASLDQGGGLKH